MSYYPVYLVIKFGMPRNHHAIFVGDESGTLFHVIGNIQSGMTFETRQLSNKPDLSNTFLSKSQLGWVRSEDLPRVESTCRANPPPAKQFNGLRRINENQPLRRCQEWTSETVENLKAEGVLLDGSISAASSPSRADTGFSTRQSSAGLSQTTEPRNGETRDGYWYWSAQYQR